ncbi:hypothetical protein [Cupriavidus nantongensis]|uniref:Uncharacterized protein n=1 Tax=Cupriavidus nantongensis TaxID=1796606 RepID=A0A142JKD7_9BURK|nr:hypothetical protein [Cupriavidus nantongensis]AMR78549.1 hypothetical protein A2G96_12810 [Cupriavidus nantongensis]
MKPYDYLGFRIVPDATHVPEIRLWMAAGDVRNAGIVDGHAEPARTPELFFTEDEARTASARQAEGMVRRHRAGGAGLADLDRERQWKKQP